MLKKVTLTGADGLTEPTSLVEITKKYPNVEFGILLSPNRFKNRYPSEDWLLELFSVWKLNKDNLNLSLHVCSKYVRDICSGNWSFLNQPILNRIFEMFQRVQLNFSPYVEQIKQAEFSKGLNIKELKNKQIIFQLKKINTPLYLSLKNEFNIVPLFDISGGRGILPNNWPVSTEFTGYAGGLTPDNVKEQYKNILNVAKGDFWLDAETGVRTIKEGIDNFDIEKVNLFLSEIFDV